MTWLILGGPVECCWKLIIREVVQTYRIFLTHKKVSRENCGYNGNPLTLQQLKAG